MAASKLEKTKVPSALPVADFSGGAEHHYFDDPGYYQAFFWGWDAKNVKELQLRLISLDAFKRASWVDTITLPLSAPNEGLSSPYQPVLIKPRMGSAPP